MNNVTEARFSGPDRQRPIQPSSREARSRAIAAMADNPAMPEALRALFTGLIGLFQHNRLLGLIASDRARMVMGWLTLYLDSCYDGRDPLSGLTVNRFKALCARNGLCSPGRAAAMLGLMRFAGHIQPAVRTRRGQPLRLVPTEKLIGPQRERIRFALLALVKLHPDSAAGLARLDDPEFFRTLIRCCCEQFLARERMVEHGPGVRFFANRKAGIPMLMCLALAAKPDDAMPPVGPVSVPAKQLARRIGTARSQVQEMLRGGVAEGLLEPAGSDEAAAYVLTPTLRASMVGFVGAIFLVLIDAIAQAQSEMEAGPQRREGAA